MGGSGSGRWGDYRKRTTTEECFELSISRLYREGLLAWGLCWQTSLSWRNSAAARPATIGVEVDTSDRARPWLKLSYTVTDRRTGEKADCEYQVRLAFTSCYFGGGRWWLLCPLEKNGRPCGRRVGRLYVPPGGRYFGCRTCYDLTYRSSQESDKRVSALLASVAAGDGGLDVAEASVGSLFLWLKAAERQERRFGRLLGK